MTILDEMVAHAADDPRREVCGLVVNGQKKSYITRGVNVSTSPASTFDMDRAVWLQVPPDHEVVATYHSHPSCDVTPSMGDKVACEATNLPMYVVCRGGGYSYIEPCGYQAPYTNRPYVHGLMDCFSIVRDWYKREMGITIKDYDRDEYWWNNGGNLYLDNFQAEGFIDVTGMPVQHGDVFLLQVRSDVPNHAVIWLEGGTILHHIQARLSRIDPWTGFWPQHAVNHLRHKTRMK